MDKGTIVNVDNIEGLRAVDSRGHSRFEDEERYRREQEEKRINKQTVAKLKKLQLTVIEKLQSIMDGEEVEAKVVQACSAATNMLKQNGITVDPVTSDSKDPLQAIMDDLEVLPTRANRT